MNTIRIGDKIKILDYVGVVYKQHFNRDTFEAISTEGKSMEITRDLIDSGNISIIT